MCWGMKKRSPAGVGYVVFGNFNVTGYHEMRNVGVLGRILGLFPVARTLWTMNIFQVYSTASKLRSHGLGTKINNAKS